MQRGPREVNRVRQTVRRFLRYVAVGAVNTAITYVAYLVLLRFVPYAVAYTIAFVAGIGIAYVLQARHVFAAQRSWGSLLPFPLVYVVQYALGTFMLAWLVESGRTSRELALVGVLAVTVPLGFAASSVLFKLRARRRLQ